MHVDAGVKISQFKCNECVEQMHLKTISKKKKKGVLLLFPDDISIVQLLSKIIYVNETFHDGEKNYNILDEDYIVINMNKDIKKQLNYNDSTITENHALINKIKNDQLLKKHARKLLNDE